VQKLGLRIRTLPLILSVSRRETRMMDRIPASTADIVRFAASVLPDKHVSVLRSRQAADKWIDERDGQVVRPGAHSRPPPTPARDQLRVAEAHSLGYRGAVCCGCYAQDDVCSAPAHDYCTY
jgi:hypothetical protein